ncbi:MAG TPA: ABC transporter permease [Terriglobia bacterium]|nr:ABC transporter permease [Terriglobia bacterium]
MGTFFEDVRYGLRILGRNPGFAAVAVLSLALGIGANTAIFSLIDVVMLKQLPVNDPQHLVVLSDPSSEGVSIGSQGGTRSLFSYPEFEYFRDHNQVFSGLLAVQSNADRLQVSMNGAGDQTEEVRSKLVSGDYFKVLGVAALLGRTFTAEMDRTPGANPLAVISYAYWKRRFALDPSVLGKTVQVHGNSFNIIGVAPQGFFGEEVGVAPDLWMPLSMQRQVMPGRDWISPDKAVYNKIEWLQVIGRLKLGITEKQAAASINVDFQQLLTAQAGSSLTEQQRRQGFDQKIELSGGSKGTSGLRDEFSQPLLVLMALVGMVLLIACTNVANLLLARATARQKEIGVRLALGAGRRRLVQQLLTESVLLATLGGALGLALAHWGDQLLMRLVARRDQLIPLDLHPDLGILGFTLAVALLTGILFGIVPAFRATRLDLAPTLKASARGTTGGRTAGWLGKGLVSAQVAMSLLLLIGAGLFVRSLRKLLTVNLGYNPDKLVLVRIDPVPAGYHDAATAQLYQTLLDRIRAVPGVRAATLSKNGLFSHSESGDEISIAGYTPKKGQDMNARWDEVGPNYATTVGIPVLLGRDMGPQDSGNAPRVCLINQTMARYYFGDESPIGRIVTDEYPDSRVSFQVVGVVGDAKYNNLREKTPRRFYSPFFHPIEPVGQANFMVRTFADPSAVAGSIRREIQSVDRAIAINGIHTMGELVDDSVVRDRLIATLSAFLGTLALLLASIGLYGVMSYAVARRTSEIGIRMALGARRLDVVGMVLRETMLMVAVGVAVGLPVALAVSRFVSSRLYGLSSNDPLSIVAATLILLAVAVLAGTLPAHRASRVDPTTALRYE